MAAPADQRAMVSEKLAPVLLTTKHLSAFDLTVIFVGIVLFINNSAGLAPNGPSMFIIWIVAFLTFLIPGNIVTAQLGRMFPEEGSLYVWTHKALRSVLGVLRGIRRVVAGADGHGRSPGPSSWRTWGSCATAPV